MAESHRRLLEGIVRLGERLGPLSDARGALLGIAEGLVEDLGMKGAGIWRALDGGVALDCGAGRAGPRSSR